MAFNIFGLDNAPADSKDSLLWAKKKYGLVPNILGIMAASPSVIKSFVALDDLFDQTSLTRTEQQVVQLAVSIENGCTYCTAVHTVIAGMHDIPPEIVKAIKHKAALQDPKLEALRVLATDITANRGYPDDVKIDAFLAAGYTRAQLLEVVLGVTLKTLTNYTNHLADTLLDQAFQAAADDR